MTKVDVKAETAALLDKLGVAAGAWQGGDMASFSPVSGEEIARLKTVSAADAGKAIDAAHEAFKPGGSCRRRSAANWCACSARNCAPSKIDLGRLVSIEAGKITSEGLGEVQEMIDICDFAVGLSRQLYGLTIATERPGHRMMETWHPLGVVGIISAFNFPVAVWSWNAALALVAGNSIVWKPSEKTPLTALACQAIFERALARFGDAPANLSQVLIGDRAIGEALVDNPRSRSSRPPARPAWARKSAPRLAKRFARSILELGGNNAGIVCPSPISTWRCAPSPSAPWAPPASAAPRCAASSCMTASTTSSCRA
jgi:aldehyde dehydrogenase (NAD+)